MNRAILVKSCRNFRTRRHGCWESWFGELVERGIPCAFIVGGPEHDDDRPGTTSAPLYIYTTGGDKYQDNSIKLREALRHALRVPSLERIFVCDDDTFVHPKRWLAHEPAGDLECRIYRPPKTNEWIQTRAWANGGAGYWMSRRLCELYISECVQRTSAEDMLVYGWAQGANMKIVDRSDLYGDDKYEKGINPAGLVSADNTLITCHPVEPEEMRTLYEATKEC
jgi:hypothetical protein